MKKIIAVIFSVLLSLSVLSGCGGGKKLDETKTNLLIANYNGGIGTDWLEEAVGRFNAAYAGQIFEEGKTGFEIHVDPNENLKTNSQIEQNLNYDLFFAESICCFG